MNQPESKTVVHTATELAALLAQMPAKEQAAAINAISTFVEGLKQGMKITLLCKEAEV